MTREMIREMEIINASKLYSEHEYNKIIFENGFIMGARWADDNHKSPWISVKDDLPCNHIELMHPIYYLETQHVVTNIQGHYYINRMVKYKGKWVWETGEPTHWMPIPELPKE